MRRLVASLLLPAAAGAARNLTFLHIPKTAGATIEELGGPGGPFRKHKCGRANVTFKREHCDMWHVPPRDLLAGREAWYPRDSTFCVVRDPVARLLSEFKFLHRQKPAQLNDAAFASDWVERAARELALARRADGALSGHNCHMLPQWWYVWDERGRCTCRFVLRFERVEVRARAPRTHAALLPLAARARARAGQRSDARLRALLHAGGV